MLDRIREWNARHKFLVILIALVVSIGLLALMNTAKASGVETKQHTCAHSTEGPCSVSLHVKRFKAGKYGRVHGQGSLAIFASSKAKRLAMTKLARKMPKHPMKVERHATCKKAPAFACPPTGVSTRGGTREGHRRCMTSELCRAYNRWGETANALTCIGVDQSYLHPNCNPYRLLNPSPELTWHEVLVGGSLALCGTAVVIGVVTKAGSVAVGMLGSSCAWGFLRDTTDQ